MTPRASCPGRRTRVLLFAGLLLAAAPAGLPRAASAGQDWRNEEGYKRLLRGEARTLRPLLEAALEADYRRQAWYLADRILAAAPDDEQAVAVLERFTPQELQLGAPLKRAFRTKLENTLRELGDRYFHFGETLEAAGIDPVDYYPINLRAQAYGSVAGPLVASMAKNGYQWLGTYGHEPEAKVRTALGPELFERVRFPPEWDDEYLKLRCAWSACRVVAWEHWRLVTDVPYDQALAAVRRIHAVASWFTKHVGKGRWQGGPATVLLFRSRDTYLTTGRSLVRERYRAHLTADTGYWVERYARAFVSDADPENPWVGEGITLQGMVARALASKRYAKGKGGKVTGQGEWLLQGFRGLGEALRRTDAERETMVLDPAASWRLAVARALREQELLIPWAELFDLTEARRLKTERLATLGFTLGGSAYEAKHVDPVTAQATAFAVGVALTDGKRGPKALGRLVGQLTQAGTLGDPWKALRWKPEKLMRAVLRALETR